MRNLPVFLNFTALFAMLFLAVTFNANAAEKKNIKGWELDSPYNKLYNPKERDTLKGKVIKFTKVTPLPGMARGTALIVEEGKDDKTLVHICPQSYATASKTGIKRGDKVKIKGSWVEIDDEFIFIAAKITKGESFAFKVRLTSDGTPFWTMSPEMLAKELAETE